MNKYYEEFVDILNYLDSASRYFSKITQPKSIRNIELFWIYIYLRKYTPNFVFESGVYKGRSSIVFAETLKRHLPGSVLFCSYWEENEVHNDIYDISKEYSNMVVLSCPGEKAVSSIDPVFNKESSVIAIIDGPKFRYKKGKENCSCAYIYDKLINNYNCLAIFQHDVDRSPDRDNFINYHNTKIKDRYSYKFLSEEEMGEYRDLDDFEYNFFNIMGVIEKKSS